MKNYFYIMANESKDCIHVGSTTDVSKMLAFYKTLPPSLIDGTRLNRLVYLEEYTLTESSHERFEQVSKFTLQQKKELIETVNPNYLEITLNDIN